MKKIVLIIQARMGSTRLPGKSILKLAGETLVGRIIERVKRCKLVNQIVLAIPNSNENQVLFEIGEKYNVYVFKGSEFNLLERYFEAALKTNADYVVRLPADNATPEPNEIDKIINHHINLQRVGFSSNLSSFFGSGYPDGIGAEIFDFSLLEDAYRKEKSAEKLEHVHLNFFNYSTQQAVDMNWCPISTIKCPREYRRPDLILDINTYEQYQFIKNLYEYMYPNNPNFSILDTIYWYDNVYKNDV